VRPLRGRAPRQTPILLRTPAPPAQRSAPVLPPARRTRHHRSLLWWAALAAIGAVVYWQQLPASPPTTTTRPVARPEREAFVALSFARISDTMPDVLSSQRFREQLTALKHAGYSTIGLDDLDAFYRQRAPLPEHPLLLVFGEAQRETMDIADSVLASLDMRGVFFVNVHGVADANVDLVSRHRLRQLVRSGRWQAGIDSTAADAADRSPAVLFDAHRRDRELLEAWTGSPVMAIAEQRVRLDDAREEDAWSRGLRAAGYRLGLVLSPPRANYVDESPYQIRSFRVAADASGAQLASQLAAREPRRGRFVDDFTKGAASPSWVVDHGQIDVADRALRISSKEGQSGAQLWLAGTERWRDGTLTVSLAGPPQGQFWISLRARPAGPSMRLGVASGRVILQRVADGQTNEIASREVGSGPIEVRLRMVGGRADAALNGESMLQRPADVPPALSEGAVSLAVWSSKGEASARVRRVEAEPLPSSLALVAPSPDDASWNELRRRADELAIVSPTSSFADDVERDGRATLAIEIFARYHHLDIYPAFSVDHELQAPESQRLIARATHAAQSTDVDGINLVLTPALASSSPTAELVSALRSRLRAQHKPLIVTVLGRSVPARLDDVAPVFVAGPERGSGLAFAEEPIRLVQPGT
jgi:hypothetical protein